MADETSSAALSVEQAVGLLDAAPTEGAVIEPEENAAEQTETEATPEAEETVDPEEAIDGEGEEQEGDPETPAIAAPKSWNAEDRAKFALAPPEVQAVILARETERDRAVTQAQSKASEAIKRAEQEVSTLGNYKAQLDQLIPAAQKAYGDRWANVDFAAWAQQDPAAAIQGRMAMEQEQANLARLQAAHQQTAAATQRQWLLAEDQKLADLCPPLHQESGEKQKLATYLVSQGVPAEDLSGISAVAAALAYKAMKYNQAKSSVAPKPRTATAQTAPGRPAAQPAARAPQRVTEARSRFQQTLSVDDAVAYLNTRQ